MKKHFKLAAALSTAALFTLGLTAVSFAASKGTWMMVDGEWYCYDSNGDIYENTFCTSNGNDYYVGDDGRLVRSDWVEYDGDYYFVNSSGQKVLNDWRLTTPYDDPDGEEEWYYFQSTGKMASNKKLTIKSKVYFFNTDGQMLTGWVTSDGTEAVNEANSVDSDQTYYCDETGASLRGAWVKSTEPGTAEDDADAEEYWYYLKTTGRIATGKNASINGQTYLFDEEGRMLSGWVGYDGTRYKEIDGETDSYSLSAEGLEAVYYCGDEDDGHVKKNRWLKFWRPSDAYDEDYDIDQYWYWLQSDGKVYIPSDSNAALGNTYKLGDGELEYQASVSISMKKVNSKDYFFNQNGEMLSKFVEVTDGNDSLNNGMYYFGGEDDGSMKTGSQSVQDEYGDVYKFYFGTTANAKTGEQKGVGITGIKSSKLYYKGLLIQADEYKYQTATIDGHTFIVNAAGTVQHSQLQYKENSEVLIDTKTVTDGEDVVYQIIYSTADDQWKYSIDEDASIGALKNYVNDIDITGVMKTIGN